MITAHEAAAELLRRRRVKAFEQLNVTVGPCDILINGEADSLINDLMRRLGIQSDEAGPNV